MFFVTLKTDKKKKRKNWAVYRCRIKPSRIPLIPSLRLNDGQGTRVSGMETYLFRDKATSSTILPPSLSQTEG